MDKDAEEEREALLRIQSIKKHWPGDVEDCIPFHHPLRQQPASTWPTSLLRLIQDLAKLSPVRATKCQARRRAWLAIADDFKETNPTTTDALKDALRAATRAYVAFWPPNPKRGPITATKSHPDPHAIEDFGAYEQPTAPAQASADAAVLSIYDNAINDSGAAFGHPASGPTVSTSATACRKRDWTTGDPTKGELWATPAQLVPPVRDGGGGGYGDVDVKSDFIVVIEARLGVPLARFLRMPDLRPEHAFLIPVEILDALAAVVREFPGVKGDDLYGLLVREKKKKEDGMGRRKGDICAGSNITEDDIYSVRDRLRGSRGKTGGEHRRIDEFPGRRSPGRDQREKLAYLQDLAAYCCADLDIGSSPPPEVSSNRPERPRQMPPPPPPAAAAAALVANHLNAYGHDEAEARRILRDVERKEVRIRRKEESIERKRWRSSPGWVDLDLAGLL
ncbi:uncharacterized protein BKCO1_36000121 [Diplodia corticola]|uniref:Uncharacterized protein n=1 Tax=Diplodia corticola TaxID=236234 RepID=A0A1J9QW92_9PEZI|nr:uncharacterized protein BKCO1_36000121 [Diplodia corticola]OJD32696.1 hypothetical protein BKCO1_36000121 [Diplodia corticola]